MFLKSECHEANYACYSWLAATLQGLQDGFLCQSGRVWSVGAQGFCYVCFMDKEAEFLRGNVTGTHFTQCWWQSWSSVFHSAPL
jgi:hypothetical protein